MLSTILELAGFVALAAAAFLIAGAPAALIVGGVELVVLGMALDQTQLVVRRPPKR
jgi:uncharacterized membrane protein